MRTLIEVHLKGDSFPRYVHVFTSQEAAGKYVADMSRKTLVARIDVTPLQPATTIYERGAHA